MPITEATHVLTWFPPGHLDPAAIWELRENKEPWPVVAHWSCAPSDTDPAELAKWVTGDLGEPVHLGGRQETWVRAGFLRRTITPFYYVFPGER